MEQTHRRAEPAPRLKVKVYGNDGKLMQIFEAATHEEAIRRLESFPEVVKAANADGFKLRIEDEAGKGCWVVV